MRDSYTEASKRPRNFVLFLSFRDLYSAFWAGMVFRTHMMMITEVFLTIYLLRCSSTFMFDVQETERHI